MYSMEFFFSIHNLDSLNLFNFFECVFSFPSEPLKWQKCSMSETRKVSKSELNNNKSHIINCSPMISITFLIFSCRGTPKRNYSEKEEKCKKSKF